MTKVKLADLSCALRFHLVRSHLDQATFINVCHQSLDSVLC